MGINTFNAISKRTLECDELGPALWRHAHARSSSNRRPLPACSNNSPRGHADSQTGPAVQYLVLYGLHRAQARGFHRVAYHTAYQRAADEAAILLQLCYICCAR